MVGPQHCHSTEQLAPSPLLNRSCLLGVGLKSGTQKSLKLAGKKTPTKMAGCALDRRPVNICNHFRALSPTCNEDMGLHAYQHLNLRKSQTFSRAPVSLLTLRLF